MLITHNICSLNDFTLEFLLPLLKKSSIYCSSETQNNNSEEFIPSLKDLSTNCLELFRLVFLLPNGETMNISSQVFEFLRESGGEEQIQAIETLLTKTTLSLLAEQSKEVLLESLKLFFQIFQVIFFSNIHIIKLNVFISFFIYFFSHYLIAKTFLLKKKFHSLHLNKPFLNLLLVGFLWSV